MNLTDLLVHIDSSPASTARINLACSLARRHVARLTGLSVITPPYYAPRQNSLVQRTVEAGELFRRKASEAGVVAEWRCIEWAVVGVDPADVLIRHSHCTDLVIVGQGETGEGGVELVERLVIGSGRPVLVIPYAGTFASVGERVLVAWRGGREATRAVNDALPLLCGASQVTVLAVNQVESGDRSEGGSGDAIREHLARHGVTAALAEVTASGRSVGDVLLSRACEEGYDLLVMGAFATNHQGAPSLGAVAMQILREMTLPVLMAH